MKAGFGMQYYPPLTNPSALVSPSSNYHHSMIEVYGEGTVSAEPDRVLVTLGVVTENKSVTVAQNENTATMTRVIDSLLSIGIPKESIKTVEYSIDPQYDYEHGTQTLRGYKTTHLLQVKIDQVANTGLVMDTAVNQGANSITGVQFTLSHPDKYYNQALSFAIKNAQQKALTISQTLGVALNPIPTEILETTPSKTPTPLLATFHAASAATPVEAGKQQITATIRAKFSYFS
jgi:uncharacterized protein YggE